MRGEKRTSSKSLLRSASTSSAALSGQQQGGTPAHAVADDEELFASGCRDLDGRTTWHGGAAGEMEESGGDPGRGEGRLCFLKNG